MSKALLVIDVQNDYFADGKFPLWNAEIVSENDAFKRLSMEQK